MLCRSQAIGLAVLFFGAGVLIGSLLPPCWTVRLLAAAVMQRVCSCVKACEKGGERDEGCCLEEPEVFVRHSQIHFPYQIISKRPDQTGLLRLPKTSHFNWSRKSLPCSYIYAIICLQIKGNEVLRGALPKRSYC